MQIESNCQQQFICDSNHESCLYMVENIAAKEKFRFPAFPPFSTILAQLIHYQTTNFRLF